MSEDLSRDEWLHLLKTSVEAAAHGVVITNRDGEIIWTNPAFTEMTGYQRSEVIGANPSILNSGVQDESFYESMWSTLLSGETWRGEIVNRRKDGSHYTERQSIRPVYFQDDEITHFIAIKEDISERKQLTSQLMEIDRMMVAGTLAEGVAHEINNPLAYVRSNLETLFRQLVVHDGNAAFNSLSIKDVREILEDALDGTRRIQEIVSDLSTFSTREKSPEVEEVDLEDALETALRIGSNQIKYRARVTRDYTPNATTVLGNESQLVQVFLNLLLNAAHAIPEEGAGDHEICVSTSSTGQEVVVEVSDTGAGIPEDVLPHIFEPFFTTTHEGTGLGLSICHNIVRRFGGRIEVESQPGVGSTFRIRFPAPEHGLDLDSTDVGPAPKVNG